MSGLQKVHLECLESLNKGGRVFFFGAGTSGRLAVLEAAEMWPTFGSKNEIIGLIAGGKKALLNSVEGAEDDPQIFDSRF